MRSKQHSIYPILLAVGILLILTFAACQYTVPITERPTRGVDAKLIGNWQSTDGRLRLKVRALTENVYIVSYNGLLFEAFHSDISGVAFLTAQELETPDKSYSYLKYRVSEDGTKLYLRLVNDQIIPRKTNSTVAIQKLLKQNLENPALFRNEDELKRVY